jgi:hypothetical protein
MLVCGQHVIQDPADLLYVRISDRRGGRGRPSILWRCPGVTGRKPVDDVGHKSSRLVANAASDQPLLLLLMTADGSGYPDPARCKL